MKTAPLIALVVVAATALLLIILRALPQPSPQARPELPPPAQPAQPAAKPPEAIPTPTAHPIEVEVIGTQREDAPDRRMLMIDAVVSGNITEQSLRRALGDLLQSASQDHDWKHGQPDRGPTEVSIYLFISKVWAKERSTHIATLDWCEWNGRPDIDINQRQLDSCRKPTTRFSLDDSQRQNVFRLVYTAAVKAASEGEKAYPNDEKKSLEVTEALLLADCGRICRRYKISQEQLDEILVEGMESHWPSMPQD